jgi:hypothetical protein
MEKEKKRKHPYTAVHSNITCTTRNCQHPIKLNVIERSTRGGFTCYFHGMLEKGKTHIDGVPIKELLNSRNRRLTQN